MRRSLSYFDKFTFWFTIIDVLFLPFFWIKSFSISMPIVFIWFLINLKRFNLKNKTNKMIIWLSLFMILSTILGCIFYLSHAFDNIVRVATILYALVSFVMFSNIYKRSKSVVKKKVMNCLFYFMMFAFLWAVLYVINQDIYMILRHYFNYRIEESTADLYTNTIRFGYYWSDENNISYITCGTMLFIVLNSDEKMLKKILSIISAAFIAITTMSTGGIVSFAISICIVILYLLKNFYKRNVFSKLILIIPVILIISVVVLQVTKADLVSELLDNFVNRINAKLDNGDNRSNIYKMVFSNIDITDYIILGRGGKTIINGKYASVHNGVVHLFISYGLFATLLYIFLIFGKRKRISFRKWIWRLPIFIGFFLNIMITEDKLSIIIMLMIAFESDKVLLFNRKKIQKSSCYEIIKNWRCELNG